MNAAGSKSSDNATDFEPERLIRAAGDRALLITLVEHADVAEVVAVLRTNRITGVQDMLPAAQTVLVTLLSVHDADPVRRELGGLLAAIYQPGQERVPRVVSRGTASDNEVPEDTVLIPVRYDGADLDEVARLLNLTTEKVIAEHTGTVWRCAFVGFAPGFGYLESPDGRLTVPRRTEARTSIPAGAVALAGGYAGVYPRGTPGGWQLIGTTELRMWDVDRNPPALIRAGAAVRFVDVSKQG
jgi:KipI family sensor histidine kinase inhibitor